MSTALPLVHSSASVLHWVFSSCLWDSCLTGVAAMHILRPWLARMICLPWTPLTQLFTQSLTGRWDEISPPYRLNAWGSISIQRPGAWDHSPVARWLVSHRGHHSALQNTGRLCLLLHHEVPELNLGKSVTVLHISNNIFSLLGVHSVIEKTGKSKPFPMEHLNKTPVKTESKNYHSDNGDVLSWVVAHGRIWRQQRYSVMF